MKKTDTLYCIGIDGCKDGWIAVYCPALVFEKAKVVHYQTLYQLQDDFSENSIIVIDIPIGLERHKANRSCDTEARKLLRQRSSTVFSPPCRDAIYSKTYEEAKKINIQKTGKSISKQSWFISKKILETRKFIESQKILLLKEGHPECSFTEYLGTPIIENKKGIHGMFKRMEVLQKLNFNLPSLVEMVPKNTKIAIDDLFDATILCWTANRIFKGVERTLPEKRSDADEFYIYI